MTRSMPCAGRRRPRRTRTSSCPAGRGQQVAGRPPGSSAMRAEQQVEPASPRHRPGATRSPSPAASRRRARRARQPPGTARSANRRAVLASPERRERRPRAVARVHEVALAQTARAPLRSAAPQSDWRKGDGPARSAAVDGASAARPSASRSSSRSRSNAGPRPLAVVVLDPQEHPAAGRPRDAPHVGRVREVAQVEVPVGAGAKRVVGDAGSARGSGRPAGHSRGADGPAPVEVVRSRSRVSSARVGPEQPPVDRQQVGLGERPAVGHRDAQQHLALAPAVPDRAPARGRLRPARGPRRPPRAR